MPDTPEVVVAGASMAIVLARRGLPVLLLEKSAQFVDRIRGESIPAWGVVEAKKLGILDLILAAGGHYVRRVIPYGEGVPPDIARAQALPIDTQVPDAPGNLTIGHPRLCETLTRIPGSTSR